VPTKYYETSTEYLSQLGVSMIIWANHNLRSSVNAMQETCKMIYLSKSLVQVEPQVRL